MAVGIAAHRRLRQTLELRKKPLRALAQWSTSQRRSQGGLSMLVGALEWPRVSLNSETVDAIAVVSATVIQSAMYVTLPVKSSGMTEDEVIAFLNACPDHRFNLAPQNCRLVRTSQQTRYLTPDLAAVGLSADEREGLSEPRQPLSISAVIVVFDHPVAGKEAKKNATILVGAQTQQKMMMNTVPPGMLRLIAILDDACTEGRVTLSPGYYHIEDASPELLARLSVDPQALSMCSDFYDELPGGLRSAHLTSFPDLHVCWLMQ